MALPCSIFSEESILARRTTSKNASDGASKAQTAAQEATAPDGPLPDMTDAAPSSSKPVDLPAPSEGVTHESAVVDTGKTEQNTGNPPLGAEPSEDATLAQSATEDKPAEPVLEAGANIPANGTDTQMTPEMAENPPLQPEKEGQRSQGATPVTASKPAMLPLVLGGVLAGGLGYGAHFLTDRGTSAGPELDSLRSEIAELRAALPSTGPLEAELLALRAQVDALSVPAAATTDLEQLIAQLRAEFAQTDAPIDLQPVEHALAGAQSRMDALEAELADLRDLAERRVAEAEAAIDAALATAGIDTLRAALETGAPYPEAVTRLRAAGVTVPDVFVVSAESGIATLEALQEGFADAARAALRVALQDAPAETTADRLGNFLRAQVGARSTVPRDGDDPDAVLSRAGAAMEGGALEVALAEIAALPEPAKAAMGDWLVRAQARSAATAALPDLATAITPE